ncbi:MAG: TolC family protein, partial [Bacteroidales bacterium]|nr:TolC family protein [Bacteroidales bacterium]
KSNKTMKIRLLIYLHLLTTIVYAEGSLTDYLRLVEANNQTIATAAQLKQTSNIGSRTGIYPDNPSIQYGYFPGDKDEMGIKTVYGISQSFDFPTVYSTQHKIAKQKDTLHSLEYEQTRMNVLLDAKVTYYHYVFLLKKKKQLKFRLSNAEKIYTSYQQKLNKGNASALEVNKSKILFLSVKSKNLLLDQEIASVHQQLNYLVHNSAIYLSDTNYDSSILPAFDSLRSEVNLMHPVLKKMQQQQALSELEIHLQKQYSFPSFEVGYASEKEREGNYSGVRAGLSIPIWKDKNTIKLAKAQSILINSKQQDIKSRYFNQLEIDFNKAVRLQEVLSEYENTLLNTTDIELINKAFELGEISVIDYIMEISFFYDIYDEYLETEKQYHLTLANLLAHRL